MRPLAASFANSFSAVRGVGAEIDDVVISAVGEIAGGAADCEVDGARPAGYPLQDGAIDRRVARDQNSVRRV